MKKAVSDWIPDKLIVNEAAGGASETRSSYIAKQVIALIMCTAKSKSRNVELVGY